VTGSLLLAELSAGHLASFDVQAFNKYLFSDLFFGPVMLVVAITLIAQTAGIILGFPLALGRLSKNPFIHLPVDLYLYIFRGTPLLLQIAFMYDGIAELFNNPPTLFFITRNAVVAGTLALMLNEAAYMTEIIRSGLQAIDPGQYDASRALGMTPGQIARKIVIPQTMRIALPPTVNEYINMSKNTSLLGTVSVIEIFATMEHVSLATYKVFEIQTVAAIWYLLITTLLTQLQRQVENRFGERQDVSLRPSFARRLFMGTRDHPEGADIGGH